MKRVRIAPEREWIPTEDTLCRVVAQNLKSLRLVALRRTYPTTGSALARNPIRDPTGQTKAGQTKAGQVQPSQEKSVRPRVRILAETPLRKSLVTLSATWDLKTKTLSHLKRLTTVPPVKSVEEWHALHETGRGSRFLPLM